MKTFYIIVSILFVQTPDWLIELNPLSAHGYILSFIWWTS